MTVEEAIAKSIARRAPDTASVRGISLQIIAEMLTLAPGQLIPVRHPLIRGQTPNVNLCLQAAATANLIRAVDGTGRMLVAISMLRSCAQQLLLHRCFKAGAGVPLADPPGQSRHERGGAVDVADHAKWRGQLEAHGWRWRGAADPAHFSHPAATVNLAPVGVRAFQRLANRHGASLKEDGAWGHLTEREMLKAPAEGFKVSEQPALNQPDRLTFDGAPAAVRMVTVGREHYLHARELCALMKWQIGWDEGSRTVAVRTKP
jgi:hypothetical protein